MFLKILQNSQGNTCARVSFLIKWQALDHFLENMSGGCFCEATCYSLGKKCNTWTEAFQVVCKCRPGLETARSSHQRCSVKKAVLKNVAKFTRKHLCQILSFKSLFLTVFIRIQALM